MSTDVVTTKTFQEKMFERIRDQMSDLMTEDDLKALVDSAMQKAFFEPAKNSDRWGMVTLSDPVFVTMIRNEMTAKVTAALQEWLSSHPEEVTKAIDDALAKGMFGLIQQHIERVASWPMQNLAEQLRAKGVLGLTPNVKARIHILSATSHFKKEVNCDIRVSSPPPRSESTL